MEEKSFGEKQLKEINFSKIKSKEEWLGVLNKIDYLVYTAQPVQVVELVTITHTLEKQISADAALTKDPDIHVIAYEFWMRVFNAYGPKGSEKSATNTAGFELDPELALLNAINHACAADDDRRYGEAKNKIDRYRRSLQGNVFTPIRKDIQVRLDRMDKELEAAEKNKNVALAKPEGLEAIGYRIELKGDSTFVIHEPEKHASEFPMMAFCITWRNFLKHSAYNIRVWLALLDALKPFAARINADGFKLIYNQIEIRFAGKAGRSIINLYRWILAENCSPTSDFFSPGHVNAMILMPGAFDNTDPNCAYAAMHKHFEVLRSIAGHDLAFKFLDFVVFRATSDRYAFFGDEIIQLALTATTKIADKRRSALLLARILSVEWVSANADELPLLFDKLNTQDAKIQFLERLEFDCFRALGDVKTCFRFLLNCCEQILDASKQAAFLKSLIAFAANFFRRGDDVSLELFRVLKMVKNPALSEDLLNNFDHFYSRFSDNRQ